MTSTTVKTLRTETLRQFVIEARRDEIVRCKCGTRFTPSYGEYHRCPECLGAQLAAAEEALGL